MIRHRLLYLWNLYPPFLGAGIRITKIGPQASYFELRQRTRWWNQNYIGTIFGGALYMMCDPFHMLILMFQLGPEYIVRDKGGEVRFLKKSKRRAFVRFDISNSVLDEIRQSPEAVQEKRFLAQIKDEQGEVIAEVLKILHIRRKSAITK